MGRITDSRGPGFFINFWKNLRRGENERMRKLEDEKIRG